MGGKRDFQPVATIASGGTPRPVPTAGPLTISVTNGNVFEAKSPVLVGHYPGDPLVSVERVLDRRLARQLSKRHRDGLYPAAAGSVVVAHGDAVGHPGAIVVGLGPFEQFTRKTLVHAVADALSTYALRVTVRANAGEPGLLSVSPVLIGSGGSVSGLSPEQSLEAIVEATLRANQILAVEIPDNGPRFGALEFIELYTDIAEEALRAALRVAPALSTSARITVVDRLTQLDSKQATPPALRVARAWPHRVRVAVAPDDGLIFDELSLPAGNLQTKQPWNWKHIRTSLERTYAGDAAALATLSASVWPKALRARVYDGTNLILDLDAAAARIPWELLGPADAEGSVPRGSRIGVLRQLRTDQLPGGRGRSRMRALVIGDPISLLPPLDGAKAEAESVAELLTRRGYRVTALIRSSADEIRDSLSDGDYEIVHVAAHGIHDADTDRIGIVLEKNELLTSIDLQRLGSTPSIVFLNCCHLGQPDDSAPRHNFGDVASSLSQALIRGGVAVVAAAGWAVDDQGALTFASSFYRGLLDGTPLINVVRDARGITYLHHSDDTTWGAYQVYGSPDFSLSHDYESLERPAADSLLTPAAAVLGLQRIVAKLRQASNDPESVEDLKGLTAELEAAIPEEWLDTLTAHVAETWAALGEFDRAIVCYGRARGSFRALQQRPNLEIRVAVEPVLGGRPVAEVDEQTRQRVADAVDRLEKLAAAVEPSVEQSCLLGSAYKRQALLFAPGEVREAILERAIASYQAGYNLARSANASAVDPYPTLNLAALLMLRGDTDQATALANEARKSAEQKADDTWTKLSRADARLLLALLTHNASAEDVARHYNAELLLGATPQERASVLEQLMYLQCRLADGTDEHRLVVDVLKRLAMPGSDLS